MGATASLWRTFTVRSSSIIRRTSRKIAQLPLDFGAAPRGPVPRAPILGEHTDEILLGVLNLSERDLGALHDKGLVAGAVSGDRPG